jgi:pSer/pThr/pTyr-binding forkhead associated (FHA) protein
MTHGSRTVELQRPALRWERANSSPVDYAVWPERPVTIGRDPTNMIAIDSPFVSKAHAIFQYTGGQYIVEDLGSSNGTRVNGAAIESSMVELGDVIEIGDERLVFVDRASETAPARRQPLGKNAKLAMAAGGTLLVLSLLFALLLSGAPSPAARPSDNRASTGDAPATGSPRPAPVESQLAADIVQRAQAGGLNPIDALMDEALVQYRVGRLRQAGELFAAVCARDPRNDLARDRLRATNMELAHSIDAHAAEAERASSQLRFDAAVSEWEKVLLLTDPGDAQHARANAGLARARAHR